MTLRRVVRTATPALALGTAALTAALAACSDSPTAPTGATAAASVAPAFVPGPHRTLATTLTAITAVTRVSPAASDAAFQITVQPTGTTVRSKDGELTATFPAGFVAVPTVFTITRKAGAAVAYDFQPSGTFSKPVIITLKASSGTPWSALASALIGAQGAYVRDWSQVNASTGTATVNEFVPTTVDPLSGTITLSLSHFSGYLVSWNRR